MIKSIFKRIFHRKRPRFPSQESTFGVLRSLGWVPETCIDVGAYHGQWAIDFRRVFPESKVLMIEAQVSKYDHLNTLVSLSPDFLDLEIAVLGATDGVEVEFTEMGTGSSILEENSPFPRQKSKMKLKRLDSVLAQHPEYCTSPMLKIDTQGYELEVLKGASNLLENVEVVLLEASLVPINRGAPLVSAVFEYMSSLDFKLFDFCSQIRRKDGVLWQTDLLFVRQSSSLIVDAQLTMENWH